MTQVQFEKSIRKGELNLGFWEALTHYMIVIFILVIPGTIISIRIKYLVTGELNESAFEIVASVLVPCALAFFIYLWQKHKLQFAQVKTTMNHEIIMQILISTANENGWEICQLEENIFVAKIPENYFPAVWGLQVTVLIDKNLILLNCICDPEKRSTVTSYGKNKKNISLLISKLTGNIKSN